MVDHYGQAPYIRAEQKVKGLERLVSKLTVERDKLYERVIELETTLAKERAKSSNTKEEVKENRPAPKKTATKKTTKKATSSKKSVKSDETVKDEENKLDSEL